MSTSKTYRLILFGLNVLLLLLFFISLSEVGSIFQFIGRLHPLILHFPIVLILAALLFELLDRRSGGTDYKKPANLLLQLGALSAVVSAIAGLLLAANGDYAGSNFDFHKWFGMATSFLATVLVILKNAERFKTFYLPAYLVTTIVMILTGHFGASLTHGEDFLTEVFKEDQQLNLDTEAPVFTQVVQPILSSKCTSCHNPNKLKGGLLLDSEAGISKGGKSGAVIDVNDLTNSMLISHVMKPMEDDLHMPPKGKPQLSTEEIELITWWVENGASFNAQMNTIDSGDPIQAVLTSYFSPEEIDIDFASPSVIASLNEQRMSVRQLTEDLPYLDVFMGNNDSLRASDLKPLRKVRKQVYSLDLGNSYVNKDILSEVAKFKNLHRLYLDNTAVTDNMLRAIRKLKKLDYLNLYGSQVTEVGAAQMAALPAISQLYLWQTQLSEEEVASLQSKFPDLTINGGLPEDSEFTRAQLAPPGLEFASNFFQDKVDIKVSYSLSNTTLLYQIDDGALQPVENDEISISKSAKLNVLAQKEGWEDSPIVEQSFIKVTDNIGGQKALTYGPKGDYQAQGVSTLFDLKKGSENFRDGAWLGFRGDDMDVRVELQQQQRVEAIYISTMDDIGSWIFPPTKLEVWGGSSPESLVKLKELELTPPEGPEPKRMKIHQLKFEPKQIKYLRIRASNYGNLPEWHPGKDTPAWLFIDEIAVN